MIPQKPVGRWTPAPPEEDVLPAYSPSVEHQGVALVKREMTGPFERSKSRGWKYFCLALNSTQLVLADTSGLHPVRVYTLQYAQAGLATDYHKRPYVIRLRVEGEQLLIAFHEMAKMVHWIVALQTAIGLSLPIEQRSIPDVAKNHRNYHGTDTARFAQSLHGEKCLYSKIESSAASLHSASSTSSSDSFASLEQPKRYDLREFARLKQSANWTGKRLIYKGRLAEVSNNTLCILSN